MTTSRHYLVSFGCLLIASVMLANGASIEKNLVYDTPRLLNGDQLVSAVINDCFDGETMTCLKGKVLTYLDTQLNINEEQGRNFDVKNVDEVIFNRVARLLATQEFRVQLPETFFSQAVISYRADRGLDFDLPQEEARGHLLKKKLLLPILLLLKLKMKALMPIFVALIGLKAMKALILSKLAITLVLGFIVYQLVMKKSAMSAMAMPMTESPMTAYGAPLPSSTSSSSYDPSSWEPTSGGGPYSRVWESPSSASASNLAYSSYYPASSSSSGSSSSALSSSSSSSGSGASHSSYSA